MEEGLEKLLFYFAFLLSFFSVFLLYCQLSILFRGQISKKITISSNLLFLTGLELGCQILKVIRKVCKRKSKRVVSMKASKILLLTKPMI